VPHKPVHRKGHVPGEEGVWVLILGDLSVFSTFFLMFAWYRGNALPVFEGGQAMLNKGYGLFNTLLLLTSSLLVAVAVHRVRTRRAGAAMLLNIAILCGLGFVGIKILEYSEKIRAGVGFATSDFFMLYFAFTGIHLIHVIIGLGVLLFIKNAARQPGAADNRMVAIESGASFWHLIDLLWIVLFALFYVLR
jgi:nitric oxide reductase NorE protein